MKLPVVIPEPCQEQWDHMQARGNGRHCFACQKTVVDFTGWEPGAILSYLKSNKQTCGRFTADQLQTQEPVVPLKKDFSWWPSIMKSGLSAISKIAAAVMLLFHLASCDTTEPVTENKSELITTTWAPVFAEAEPENDVPGDREIIRDTIMQPVAPKPVPIAVKYPEPVIMGEPAIISDTPVVTIPEPQPQIMGAPLLVPQQDSVPVIQKK
ncbi:MAG: hypothetical protein EOP54_02570 [Sphingobacteriales bacterium]|nr:MAG: hypothetical protein EOP54_02570 [Sphingobacteriales bacterium]